MQIRAPKSIGFGAKRAEKSPYKRTIPYDASLGPRGTEFESPHFDQKKDRKQRFSLLAVFLCSTHVGVGVGRYDGAVGFLLHFAPKK